MMRPKSVHGRKMQLVHVYTAAAKGKRYQFPCWMSTCSSGRPASHVPRQVKSNYTWRCTLHQRIAQSQPSSKKECKTVDQDLALLLVKCEEVLQVGVLELQLRRARKQGRSMCGTNTHQRQRFSMSVIHSGKTNVHEFAGKAAPYSYYS